MRLGFTAFAAAALGALLLAASAPAASAVRVAPVKGPKFPERAYVVHVPAHAATSRPRVRVSENGGRVKDVGAVPAAAATSIRRGLVIVIDASNSMRGRSIQAAIVAARTLAERRTRGQRVAIVTFNARPTIRLGPTADDGRIRAALRNVPALGQGTRFYDALISAVDMARDTGMRSPTVVLLSDGADTGSSASAVQVVSEAREQGTRIFTVGLRNPAFRGEPLEQLATATGGTHAVARSAAELEPVFDRLGYSLANEYVVEYLSLAGPEQKVRVEIAVEGVGTGNTTYVTPPLPVAPGPAFERSEVGGFWTSPLTMVVIAFGVAGLLAAAGLLVARPRNRLLRARLAEFVTVENADRPADRGRAAGRLLSEAERSLRLSFWARFKEDLEIANIRMSAAQIVLWTAVATLVAVFALNAFAGMPIALLALATPLVARMLVRQKLRKRQTAFAEQLPENLQILGSALRAGHSLVGALSVVVADAPEPARSEFQRVVADEQLGVPLEESMMEVARRMDCRDLEQVALVAAIGRQTGGNTADVLDQVTKMVRERFELRRLIRGLTAQGRLSNWVLSALPPGLVLIISLINPSYMDPLLDTSSGRIMLVVGAVMVITGSLVIRRIVDIRV